MIFAGVQRVLLEFLGAASFCRVAVNRLRGLPGPGLRARLMPGDWGGGKGWRDLWLIAENQDQAWMGLALARNFAEQGPRSILALSEAPRALELFSRGSVFGRPKDVPADLSPAALPVKSVGLLKKGLFKTLPRAVITFESGFSPSLLAACAEEETPVVLVNGRLSRSRLAFYLLFSRFYRRFAPAVVLAASEGDAGRLGLLFGPEPVRVMPDLAFDCLRAMIDGREGAAQEAFSEPGNRTVLLYGVGRCEAESAVRVCLNLSRLKPDLAVVVAAASAGAGRRLARKLQKGGLACSPNADPSGEFAPGVVHLLAEPGGEEILERADAVCLCREWSPGSGPDFKLLRCLAAGLRPLVLVRTGRMDRMGRDLASAGLAETAAGPMEAAKTLERMIDRSETREELRRKALSWAGERAKGASMAVSTVKRFLPQGEN